jgi:hypothetical protein
MTEAEFWSVIEADGPYRIDDQARQLDSVRRQLGQLKPEQVKAFDTLFCQKMIAAYTWDLWGAAYTVNGGCSDDGFEYFRAWLISRGQATYTAAVANPDRLAGVTDPDRDDYEFEDLCYVAAEVYEELTGRDMPRGSAEWPTEPAGDRWDFDDEREVAKRFPALAAAYSS